MKSLGLFLMFLMIFVSLPACQNKSVRKSSVTNSDGRHLYEVTGKVVAVRKEEKRLELNHDEIRDKITGKTYMAAMTMPFAVKDVTLIENLHPGDQVQATLVVIEDANLEWLEQIKVTKPAGQ